MTVVPIRHHYFNRADVRALMERGKELASEVMFGEFVPVVTSNGEQVVAVLDPDNETLIYGFGKNHGWYYVFDAHGNDVRSSRFLDGVLEVLN